MTYIMKLALKWRDSHFHYFINHFLKLRDLTRSSVLLESLLFMK